MWEVRTPLRYGSKLEKTFDSEDAARNFADQLLLSLDLDTVFQSGRVFYVQSDDDDK